MTPRGEQPRPRPKPVTLALPVTPVPKPVRPVVLNVNSILLLPPVLIIPALIPVLIPVLTPVQMAAFPRLTSVAVLLCTPALTLHVTSLTLVV